ncbi:hypothetical protein OKW76_12070 [Sphingomonas sp. S1-29]|uniref:hypothetical protein n=1 Tax=Sphingomonas sp. S1-29 TaxID=2991074 RepID=UPI00223F54C6|nr:hypothetical protein [Sphingomonas sp. S1-29]UZK68770.1 hypothetical protein OKW76_12070 [Sphingomonas sp. S1-29]
MRGTEAGKDGSNENKQYVPALPLQPSIAVECQANAIARANLAGSEVAFIFAAITVSIAAMGVVTQAAIGRSDRINATRIGGSHLIIVPNYQTGVGPPCWVIYNAGNEEARIDNITVVQAPPGTSATAITRSADIDDFRVQPGSEISITRSAAAGVNDVMLVVHTRDMQGEHFAWARFRMEFSPVRHVKQDEGKIKV